MCVGAGLELNYAGLRHSRNWVWQPCSRWCKQMFLKTSIDLSRVWHAVFSVSVSSEEFIIERSEKRVWSSQTPWRKQEAAWTAKAPGTVFSPKSITKARVDAAASTVTSFACIRHSVFWLLWISAWSIASESPYVSKEVRVDLNFMESGF